MTRSRMIKELESKQVTELGQIRNYGPVKNDHLGATKSGFKDQRPGGKVY